jgi:3-methylcrotonyl-CoA carboxylase alpha subunit
VDNRIVTIDSQQFELSPDGEALEILATRDEELEIRVAGRVHVVPYVVQGSTVYFSFDGETYVADVAAEGTRARARHRDHSTEAPMPGVVLKILVRAGDVVVKGTPLMILEALKMEHQIVAGHEGKILSINCTEGELVQPGVELVSISESP